MTADSSWVDLKQFYWVETVLNDELMNSLVKLEKPNKKGTKWTQSYVWISIVTQYLLVDAGIMSAKI